MISLSQWRIAIGCHVNRRRRHNCRYVATLRECHLNKAVLMCIMIHLVCIACLLLFQAGDVERNPGPTLFVTCPNCNEELHVKQCYVNVGTR